MFSLLLIYEGSHDLGPVPIIRVADSKLTRRVAGVALRNAKASAAALRRIDADAAVDAFGDVDRLSAVLATI